MKRYVLIVIVSLFLLAWAVLRFAPERSARAQETASPATQLSPADVRPNPAGSVAGQLGTPSGADSRNCQGCHASGKPYLAGELFHKEAHGDYDVNVHAQAVREGKKGATCLDCHSPDGRQEAILPAADPQSAINRANVSRTCGKCHEQPLNTFHDSIHGQGQARGINVAATCSDCHGAHNVFPAADARSQLSKQNTPQTCAKCHVTILEDFKTSAHHTALQRGDPRAPDCATCHTAVSHAKAPATLREFNLGVTERCIGCHEKQAPGYRDTFHGQASALGYKPAATCADCHTPHRNLPASDPRSTIHAARRIETCGKCHENASASFVTYDPHPDPHDSRRSMLVYGSYKFMTWLFIFVFGFFGVHTLLWLQRSIVGAARGEMHRFRDDKQWVRRFNKSHRWTHAVMVTSFLVLAATGLPLMYYYTGWGQALAQILGGVGFTTILHRVFAVVTFGYAFYHLGYLIWRFIKGDRLLSGPDSMVPRRKDFQDLYHMLRWFLYLDKKPPKLDRWTYWEKFDYFAVFWGVPIIGLSGLMLWLPNLVTKILPGSWLNVAMIVHGEEALLATGFIFAFHFFHNHMRPENFPLDTVIFTGRMPLRRFKAERPREYQRLRREGRLDEVLTGPPSPRARLYAKLFGFTAYIIGLILVVAIFVTLLRH